ncbi:MAG: 3-oxoacyl-ACP reductase FabG [Clostridia bacterium]|nr:3-oxoacyl-ACP reductase FabG [Clostridia bacterium]MBR6510187.1 3-oxoacyl-ACP reductase FabG [Clostridia bacterium]
MSKTVIVTGASKGIGAATAILFAQKGYNVVINYNESYESASLLCNSLTANGYSVMMQKANVANKLEVDLMVKETLYKYGSLDILVNNAGVAFQGLTSETDEIDFDRIIDVNLKGVFNCCKAVIPSMVSRQSGKIINISSMWGQVGASCEVAYSASKAGVIGLTKALAKELAPSGITVNAIAPGLIETNMNSNLTIEELSDFVSTIPLGRMGSADEIAAAIEFLASDKADYITGQVLGVNGGLVV